MATWSGSGGDLMDVLMVVWAFVTRRNWASMALHLQKRFLNHADFQHFSNAF
jgi:hypothetical protein